MKLVIGGSGSGKSSYAESLLNNYNKKYYLATMICSDDESVDRIKKHQEMRKDKGFITIEQSINLDQAINIIDSPKDSVAIVECISNLVANEMFQDNIKPSNEVSKKIIDNIKILSTELKELVVVTNNISEDGTDYDNDTLNYIKAVSDVNIGLSSFADEIVEVVAGIPINVK